MTGISRHRGDGLVAAGEMAVVVIHANAGTTTPGKAAAVAPSEGISDRIRKPHL